MAQSLGCVIIDDSLFIREAVSNMIKEAGHQVIASFGDGQEFLDKAQFLNYYHHQLQVLKISYYSNNTLVSINLLD